MSKKGAIILFVSPYRNSKSIEYSVEGNDRSYEGRETNDAPLRYLCSVAKENKVDIEKIICIASKSVRDDRYLPIEDNKIKKSNDGKTSLEYLKSFINDELNIENSKIEEIEYDENQLITKDRLNKTYNEIAKKIEDIDEIFLECTGGLRDINFLMIGIARYAEYKGKVCNNIVYSDYTQHILRPLNGLYEIYSIINGVDQFLNTGNANALKSLENTSNLDAEESNLIESLKEFSDAISICNVKSVDKKLEHISMSIEEIKGSNENSSLRRSMIADIVPLIEEKIDIKNVIGEKDYLGLIKWCVNNGLLQQALTFYTEKMPIYYYKQRYLKKPPTSSEDETSMFWDLYLENKKDPNIETLKRELKKIPSRVEGMPLHKYRNEVKKKMDDIIRNINDIDIKEALGKIYECMGFKEGKGVYDKSGNKSESKQTIYGEDCFSKRLDGQINKMKNNDYRLLHWSLYENEKTYNADNDSAKTDKLIRAEALVEIISNKDFTFDNSMVDKKSIVELLKYYLIVKIIRNRINHASEEERRSDDEKTKKIILEEFGIDIEKCTQEFSELKKLLNEAIKTNEGVKLEYANADNLEELRRMINSRSLSQHN